MPDILSFDIINPLTNNKLPFYNNTKCLLYIPGLSPKYRYYPNVGRRYYLLLNRVKFNRDCRICHTDGYGRLVIPVRGELKEYLNDCCTRTRNIEVGIVEATEVYDIYYINADNM